MYYGRESQISIQNSGIAAGGDLGLLILLVVPHSSQAGLCSGLS